MSLELNWRSDQARPRLPDGVRVYAVSDIHGCANQLEQALRLIDVDMASGPPQQAVEVYLGDHIDRGLDTRSTIQMLIERRNRSNVIFLKGNHEALLIDALRNPALAERWLRVGGIQTLVSYGIRPSHNPDAKEQSELLRQLLDVMPDEHLEFLSTLQLTYTCGDFFFVHAGVRPGVPLRAQREGDLLWIRDEFLKCERHFEKFIVHGHTPVRRAEILTNRINIDTGAYATGALTLLTIQGSRMLAF